MKSLLLVSITIGWLIPLPIFATTNEPVRFVMPDGQLRSHPIRVFLDRDLTTAMKPVLTLITSHALLNRGVREITTNACTFIARNQLFLQEIRGVQVNTTGTLLLVDLDPGFHIPWYKAVVRVTPSLTWTEPSADGKEPEFHTVGGNQEIYLGNITGAFIWTFLVTAGIVGVIFVACAKARGSVLPLFCAPDGTLSLWRTQLLAWTLAVGSVVVCFGLTRLDIPAIPDTLVALMGMSLVTGGLGYLGNREHLQSNVVNPQEKPLVNRLGELLCDDDGQLSVSRAQMLFWTLSMLLLFLIKSIQQSAVWEVPWTMVALMGVSQAGYIGSKLVPTGNAKPAN